MIDELLDAKLISTKEFKLYKLLGSELGQECLKDMQQELFWEEPDEDHFSGLHFAFYDGRRSVIRGFISTVEKVEAIIKKQLSEIEHD